MRRKNPALALVSLLAFLFLCSGLGSVAGEYDDRVNLPAGPRPVEVQVRFFLSDISNIDDHDETLEVKGLLVLQWRDARQAFDPEETGRDERVFQGNYQFAEEYDGWWPQIFLANGVGPTPVDGVLLRIAPDGTLQLIQEFGATVKSPMDLRRFPFDDQQLQVIFEPLGYFADEVLLTTGTRTTDLPDRELRVAGWRLEGLDSQARVDKDDDPDDVYSQLIVTLDMKRRPGFAVWFIILPLSLIVIASTAIFLIDRGAMGTRIDVSFIGLLTVVAYQILIVDLLPKISYFTLINGYLYVAYAVMVAGILANIWIHNLVRRNKLETADRVDDMAGRYLLGAFVVLNLISALLFLLF